MANISKSFNFKGGFQVDEDVLIVRGSNVGIGSQVPQESLDVAGSIRAEKLILTGSDIELGDLALGDIEITSALVGDNLELTGTTIGPKSGGSQVFYYGDGSNLTNIPTSQWVDIDVGLGFTSIYSAGNVGVDTNDPRYVFQVGGVPYPKSGLNANQDGVGIEDGNIDASGTIRTRGVFSGDGSLLTNINASGIATGEIPASAIPDDLVLNTVTANSFIGTATSADDVTSTADLSVNSVTAPSINATTSYTGSILTLGDTSGGAAGDISVQKTAETTIFSVSTGNASKVFVGSSIEGRNRRSYGGIRFNSTEDVDLDLVNYDVGNLNFILHDASTGTSAGDFRWIYGQSNRVLATLDRFGAFTLNGNSQSATDTLVVTGDSQFSGDVSVGGASSITGNLTVDGDLSVSGAISIPNITFDDISVDSLQIGNGAGNGGASISGVGTFGGTRLELFSGTTLTSFLSPTSSSLRGTLTSENLNVTSSLTATNIGVTTSLIGPAGFVVNSNGLGISTANITDINVSGDFNVGTLSPTNLVVSNSITSSSITANSASINGTVSAENLTLSGTASLNSLGVNGSLSASTATFTNSTLGTASASSVTSTVITATNQLNVDTINPISGVTTMSNVDTDNLKASKLEVENSQLDLGGTKFDFSVSSNGELKIQVTDSTGTIVGTFTGTLN